MINKKTPQNIQDLVGEIGERMILFKLYELALKFKNWEVFKNYSEPGYDLVILNKNTGDKIRVEAKTRQRLVSTGQSDRDCHFTLTVNEFKKADFLIGYWLERNDFFIVPCTANHLNKIKGGKTKEGAVKYVYKFIAGVNAKNNYHPKSIRHLNRWDMIEEKIKNQKT